MPHCRQKKRLDLNQVLRQCKVTLSSGTSVHSEPSRTSICVYGPWRELRICLTMEMSSSNGRDKHAYWSPYQKRDSNQRFRDISTTILRFVHWTTAFGVTISLLALRFHSKSSWDLMLFTLWTLPMVLYLKRKSKHEVSCAKSVPALMQNNERKSSVVPDTKTNNNYQAQGLFLLCPNSLTLLTEEGPDFVPKI